MAEAPILRAAVPKPTSGLVSPGLRNAYKKVMEELAKGYEDPTRDIALKGDEDIVTGLTRMAKLYTVDYPVDFLVRGGEALESPGALTSEELLGLAGEALLFGLPGGGKGPASMAGRVPLKGFFSPLQKGLRQLIGETVRGRKAPVGVVKKPGQQLMNLLKKKGVSKEELEWTGVGAMLEGGQKPIPLKNVMRQAVREEIKVKGTRLKGKALANRPQYADPSYRKPFSVKDVPYEETVLALKGKETGIMTSQQRARYKELKSKGKLGRSLSSEEVQEYRSLTRLDLSDSSLRQQKVFKDPKHYSDVENLVSWSRTEIRPGSKGEKVRMIQEVQESLWGIEGRGTKLVPGKGFLKPGDSKKRAILERQSSRLYERKTELKDRMAILYKNDPGAYGQMVLFDDKYRNLNKIHDRVFARLEGLPTLPPTPFKEDALKLMLKKELFEAASDPSVTHVGWTPGPMQAFERWPDPKAEKKLLQIYDEIVPGFMEKWSRRLGKGKKGLVESVEVGGTKTVQEDWSAFTHDTLGEITPGPKLLKVPALRMDEWLREALLKGQPIAKMDDSVKEYMYG